MAKKQKSTSTKTKSTWSFQKILDFTAYIGTACIAIALMLSAIFKGVGNSGNLVNAFHIIGETIAYVLAIILAAFWVKRKRHIAWLICYIVFVVVIVVMYILVQVL